MSRRQFQLPDSAESARPKRDVEDTSLVGGSLAERRKHGHRSELNGRFVRDPIFEDDDVEALRAWCDRDDPRPLAIEIGFQRARFAGAWCAANPDARYLGFEVRRKFCEDADAWLVKKGVNNALLALVDARSMLDELVAPESVDILFCFFPDPWWKKKHMKKRLVSRSFAALAHKLLAPGGVLLVKTDVQGYADWAEGELRTVQGWTVTRLTDPGAGLPETQRERRCRLRGLPTWAVIARKEGGPGRLPLPAQSGTLPLLAQSDTTSQLSHEEPAKIPNETEE